MASDYNLTVNILALIVTLTILLLLLCCGPLCCIFYAAVRFKALRERTLQERSSCFALQWRSQNPFVPFDHKKEWSDSSWKAWHFKFSALPKEFNGLSTETFQSPEPLIGLNSENLEEITFNPLIGSRRKSQSVQCALPLMHRNEEARFRPSCSYFEVSIISCRPSGKRKKRFGTIEGSVAIGLASRPAPPFRLPGMDAVSIGFHSRGGGIFMGSVEEVHALGSAWSRIGATVGCGYDFSERVVYFTQSHGSPIFTTFGVPDNVKNHLFPTIGADCEVTVSVNMGQHRFQHNVLLSPLLSDDTVTKSGSKAIVVTVHDKTLGQSVKDVDLEEEEAENFDVSTMDNEVQTCYPAWNLVDKEVQTTVMQISTYVSIAMQTTMGNEVSSLNRDKIYGTIPITNMQNEEQICESAESASNVLNEEDPPCDNCKAVQGQMSLVSPASNYVKQHHTIFAGNDMEKDQESSSISGME